MTTTIINNTIKDNFPEILHFLPERLHIKDFQQGKTYTETIKMYNCIEIPVSLKIKSSDSNKIALSDSIIKINPNQCKELQLTIREEKGIKIFNKRKRLFLWIKGDLIEDKFIIELSYNDHSNDTYKKRALSKTIEIEKEHMSFGLYSSNTINNLFDTNPHTQKNHNMNSVTNATKYTTEIGCQYDSEIKTQIEPELNVISLYHRQEVQSISEPIIESKHIISSFDNFTITKPQESFIINKTIDTSAIISSLNEENKTLKEVIERMAKQCKEMERLLGLYASKAKQPKRYNPLTITMEQTMYFNGIITDRNQYEIETLMLKLKQFEVENHVLIIENEALVNRIGINESNAKESYEEGSIIKVMKNKDECDSDDYQKRNDTMTLNEKVNMNASSNCNSNENIAERTYQLEFDYHDMNNNIEMLGHVSHI